MRWFGPISYSQPLSAAQWTILAGVPVGIIALYFLKLRRRPVQVSSTLLWRRSLEDLHVNSLFQRLRKNLLLFLQLLIVLLAMLALMGPRLKGTSNEADRLIIAIDESASMGATDVSPTRFEKAKAEADKFISNMERDDVAMIVGFSDRARVVANYTANKQLLRQRLAALKPTSNTTSIREALQVIAGLANPSSDLTARNAKQGERILHDNVPPKLKIFTDGGFPDVEGLSVGNVEPEVIVIGPVVEYPPPPKPGQARSKESPPTNNVAILALSATRGEEKTDQFQVFGRVRNYRGEEVKTEARLFRHDPKKPGSAGVLLDAIGLTIAAQSEQSFKFDLNDDGLAELEVRLDVKDALALDNSAFTVFGAPRKAQILLVTEKNRYLTDSLATLSELSDVVQKTPAEIKVAEVKREIAAGRYDLIIYDSVSPETAPEANALYFGVLPPGKAFAESKVLANPVVLTWDVSHPMMQYIRDLSTVVVRKAVTCEIPTGATPLIEGNGGALAFIAPRGGFVDAVVGFSLLDGTDFNTNWQLKSSFPLFLYNTIRSLGNARDSSGDEIHLPDMPTVLRADSLAPTVDVYGPTGTKLETVKRSPQGTFVFNSARTTGLYQVRWGKDQSLSFAVNLFDPRESDLAPRGIVPPGLSDAQQEFYKIKIGFNAVEGKRQPKIAVKDYWWFLAIGMLGVVLTEWYIYNRRVYV
jgi:hypothetical protein